MPLGIHFNCNLLLKGNLKGLLEELTQNYQNLKAENEQTKRNVVKLNQEHEERVEEVKRQHERQKQKELEAIREYVCKVFKSLFIL